MPSDLSYGPGAPTEAELKLLGPVAGKRVLVLGCADVAVSASLAEQEAKVLTVEPDADRVTAARESGLAAEVHHVDFAELAFIRAATIDAAVAVLALAEVDDLDRVFRQVHRTMRTQAPFALSLPHPATGMPEGRSWFDRSVSDVFTSLLRTSFAVDVLLEPLPAPGARLPQTLILRGRKLGS